MYYEHFSLSTFIASSSPMMTIGQWSSASKLRSLSKSALVYSIILKFKERTQAWVLWLTCSLATPPRDLQYLVYAVVEVGSPPNATWLHHKSDGPARRLPVNPWCTITILSYRFVPAKYFKNLVVKTICYSFTISAMVLGNIGYEAPDAVWRACGEMRSPATWNTAGLQSYHMHAPTLWNGLHKLSPHTIKLRYS
jgi:hypothetical protein